MKTADAEDRVKREERLRDDQTTDKETAVFKVSASKSSEKTTGDLKSENGEGHSENGISVDNAKISKTDVNDNGTVSTCGATQNEQKAVASEINSTGSEKPAAS